MKSVSKFLVVLVAGVLGASPALAKKPKPQPVPVAPPAAIPAAPPAPEKVASVEGITEYRLGNGLKVLLFPDQTKQTITVNVTYLVGSRHENYGETGMAHLLEHMLFKGTPRHKDIAAELTSHGTRPNGSTSWDRTNYFETFNANDENLKWALDLESDRMVNSRIAKEDLDTEMTVVRNEYESSENSPLGVLFKRLLAVSYDWHNYGKTPLGARSDIEGVPIDRLQAFYRLHYQPDNAVLLVAGKFDEAATLAQINAFFGAIPKPARVLPELYTVEPVQDGERQVTLRRTGDVQIAAIAYHVPPAAHADYAPLQVLVDIMGNQPAGRLFKDLVETQKAATVLSTSLPLAEPGMALFGAQVRAEKPLDAALKGLIADVENGKARPITDAEVERSRTLLLKQIELNLNNAEGIGLELSNWMGMGDWRLLFVNRDRLRAVKTADVQRVWSTYFKASNRTTGLFYPTKDADRATVPGRPDVVALVKDYKGDAAKEEGEAFDPSPANIDARTQRSKLPGGTKLVLLPKKTRGGAVVATMALHFGDAKSLMNRGDVGPMTGAMLMRGSLKHTRQQISDELDRLKARVDIGGGSQGGAVNIETTRENLPAVLTLVTEVLRQPAFDAKELELLRSERLASIEQQSKEPNTLAFTAFSRIFAPYPRADVRYVPTVEETIADIKAVTREQLVAFHKDFYGAQAAEIAVVGDFDPKALAEQLQRELGDWKAPKPYTRVASPYVPIPAQKLSIETPDKANAFFVTGTAFSMRDDNPDYPALVFGNYMLGGSGLKSRLFARIRIKEGLSYGGRSQVQADENDDDGGFLSYWIYAPQNYAKLQAAFDDEIAKAINEGFSAEDIAQEKNGWQQGRSVSRSQDKELVRALAAKAFNDRTMAWDAELEKKVLALDPDTIRKVLAKYLVPANFTAVKAGDFAAAAKTP
ncbi:MAG TPA: pitrilysin family protein [Steroidobacteraceae bacterium]|nr:pitrilysin family protein [Steroidobacteraceae bacterium]